MKMTKVSLYDNEHVEWIDCYVSDIDTTGETKCIGIGRNTGDQYLITVTALNLDEL